MKIRYLGTAAAEGIPSVFCDCEVCRQARAKKGRHIRTRSQVLLDDELLVDFNADTYAHALAYDLNLSQLEHVVVTHVHEDHYYPVELFNRQVGFCHGMKSPTLTVYGSEDVEEFARREWAAVSGTPDKLTKQKRVVFQTLKPFETRTIAGFEVTAIPAVHGTPHPYIYLFSKGGKTVLYYNDSGYLTDEATAFLKEKKVRLDLVSYDCTWGKDDAGGAATSSHLGLPNVEVMRRKFIENGNYHDDTVSVITHFSHNIKGVGYDDMLPVARAHGCVLAYDGMVIEL